MRLVIQRVTAASVAVDGEIIARMGEGLLVLSGVEEGDTVSDAQACANKIANLRIFEGEAGKMNLSILQAGGEILIVSQFTLLGDMAASRRPSFIRAARPETAAPLLDSLVARLREQNLTVQTGVFGAHMAVTLTNDGPVTLVFDTRRML